MKLFSVRGIDIRIHVTFPLIILWAALQFGLLDGNLGSALFGVLAVILLFIIVTLHELGHSFAAQYYGVPVKQIVLSPLGGVAQLNQIPEKPIQEFVISIAGPAVNLLIALIMGVFAFVIGLDIQFGLGALSRGVEFSLNLFFSYIFIYNIFLALFNLVPAFPLDGGRIFRSLLAMRIEYLRATNIAAAVGKMFAFGLGVWGLFNGGIFLVLIAVFIYSGAGQEESHVALRTRLRGIKVREVYTPAVHRLNLKSTIQQASNLMIYTGQKSFPVVDGERLIGFLTHDDILRASRSAAPHSFISRFMRRDMGAVSCDEDLYEVFYRFRNESIEALPVTSRGRFMGLITREQLADLHRLLGSRPNARFQEQSA